MANKSVWDLPGGPWEKLFGGVWNNVNVAVYENPNKILLTTLFPKTGDVNWIMIRVDKILMVPKGIEKLEKQLAEKHLHILKQQMPDRNITYLILLSPPSMVEFGSPEIGAKVLEEVLDLEKESEDIVRIAKKAGVELIDLKDAPYKESAAVFGNPTLLLSLLSAVPPGEEPKKEKLVEITLGDSEEGILKVDSGIFSGYTSIKKGTEEERNYLAQCILESAIIDAMPIPLILDFGKHPLKLDSPNIYPYDYSKYGFENSPVVFKVKRYGAPGSSNPFRINLNQTSPQFIWKVLGLGKDDASMAIMSAIGHLHQSKRLDDLQSVQAELLGTGSDMKESRTVKRALRMLKTLEKAYGDLFSNGFDMHDIILGWIRNNETAYLSFSENDKRKRLAFFLYLLDSIKQLRESNVLSELEAKRASHLFITVIGMDWFGNGLMQSEITSEIVNNHSSGLFVTETELPMELESRTTYRFQIIGPGKAKYYSGGRGKEFTIRPLLSCPP